jgi:hypothetical protein
MGGRVAGIEKRAWVEAATLEGDVVSRRQRTPNFPRSRGKPLGDCRCACRVIQRWIVERERESKAMRGHRNDPDAHRGAGAGSRRQPKLGAPIVPTSPAEILLSWAGFFVGLLIMTGDHIVARRSLERQNWEFLAAPKAMVWIFLVASQFAFWANIVEPLWRWRSQLRLEHDLRQTRQIRLKLAGALLFFALPGFFLVFIVPDSNLAHHDLKMGLVHLVAVIVALPAVAGIWYVRAALEATIAKQGQGGSPERSVAEKIEVLLDLREYLQRYITLLGAMIALATLAKGALRQAILATGGSSGTFPPEYVLLQGAYFTGLLALVYIPTYTIFADIGENLVEATYAVTDPDLDWDRLYRWQANRRSLEELLQLRSGAVANLRASVSILAPAATSVISVLLGAK